MAYFIINQAENYFAVASYWVETSFSFASFAFDWLPSVCYWAYFDPFIASALIVDPRVRSFTIIVPDYWLHWLD